MAITTNAFPIASKAVAQGKEVLYVDLQNLAGCVKHGFFHVESEKPGFFLRKRSRSCPPSCLRAAKYEEDEEEEDIFKSEEEEEEEAAMHVYTETVSEEEFCYGTACTPSSVMDKPYYDSGHFSAIPNHSGFDSDVSTIDGCCSSSSNKHSGDECLSTRSGSDNQEQYCMMTSPWDTQNMMVEQFGGHQGLKVAAFNVLEEVQRIAPPPDVTTVMLKNIPCRCSKSEVLAAIGTKGFGTTYQFNFFYLPIKRGHHQNIGYAFFGFQDPNVAAYFTEVMSGFQFPGRRSVKVCEVLPARIQGIQKNAKHFSTTRVMRSKRAPIFVGENNSAIGDTWNSAPHALEACGRW